ncbi:MAG: CRTAC1 family protein [Planctomycetaceae bacterium]|nr:CRTAC1 family protein [Planctomycetaceae bacterium]
MFAGISSFDFGRCKQLLLCLAVIGFLSVFGCGPNQQGATDRAASAVTNSNAAKTDSRLKLDFGSLEETKATPMVQANYTDIASHVGLDFRYYSDAVSGNLYLPEALGGGAAAFDYDLDGWCDVYFANGRKLPATQMSEEHRDQMFRNRGGRFQPITDHAFIQEFDYTHGVAVGDFNVDGFEDVAVANFGQARLFVNQGDGSLVELELELLCENTSFWLAPLFVDLDGDGLEDLLLASYVEWGYESELEMYDHGPGYPSPGHFEGGPYLALQNLGNRAFRDQTVEWGFKAAAKCLGIGAADLDHDLKPEVYVANDGMANACYTRSTGDGINSRVTNAARESSIKEIHSEQDGVYWNDIAERSGTAGSEDGQNEASMCVTLADFTRNGWTDIFLTNYLGKKDTLYANKGQLSFRDTSRALRLDTVGAPYVSFGAVPIDFDLDGWWDVFVANGHVIGPNAPINEMPCQLIHNSSGIFYDVSASAGSFFKEQGLGRCTVTLDSTNQGLPDLLVTYTDRGVSLLQNQTIAPHPWICLEVFDPQHRPLTGGRMELKFPEHVVVIPMTAGGSYIGESQKRWTLGLGSSGAIPIVTVYWPDGRIDCWESLPAKIINRLSPGRHQQIMPVGSASDRINAGQSQ